jgi:hypothetical protein
MKRWTPKTREARVVGVGRGLAFAEPFQVSRRVVNFSRVEKLTSEEPRDATTAEPLNANTRMVVAQKREKKKGRGPPSAFVYGTVNGRETSR